MTGRTGRNQSKPDQAIDNLHRASTIDARDQRCGNAPPGVGEGETDTEEGEPSVVALEILAVTHLGQGQGVVVQGFEAGMVVVGRGVDNVIKVRLLV